MSSAEAMALKEDGNRHYISGDFVGAEALYSKAIIKDSRNPTLYTNRAMAGLKLSMWDNVISDCRTSLELSPVSMKAFYYLSQAELALKDYSAALEDAQQAYKLCVNSGDKSLPAITAQVLRCKKERWDDAEKRRIRESGQLESDVVCMMGRERDEALNDVESGAERQEISQEWEQKVVQMQNIFEKARVAEEKRRTVPDWVVDDISFGIMVDPVVTKTGKSYERASIMEHLRRQQTDPLTREPLQPSDLRPNKGLKQACDQFLEENGWAVDW